MCGIAAIWYADPESGPLGADLARMLLTLEHRGSDGAGVALYDGTSEPEVLKQIAGPGELAQRTGFASRDGSHGLGHVRMATETAVDTAHAHPYQAAAHREVTLVHNGHVTNAERLRGQLERCGTSFQTDNDSEVVLAWIVEGLDAGRDLETVLHHAVDELDGSFSIAVATADALGCVRDRFAAKPLVVVDTAAWSCVCSEGRGLPSAAGDSRRRELGAGRVRVWHR